MKKGEEELAKDKKALEEYLKGLTILQDNNFLRESDLSLWQKQKAEVRNVLKLISG